MHTLKFGFQSKFATLALVLLPATLWLLMHGYHGITEDGQLYAFQAYTRLKPYLAADLYLQNTSQDQFTVFSPLFGWVVGLVGLESAARLLQLFFAAWFFAATYGFVQAVACRELAWLGVTSVLIVAGDFGGSGVFQIVEPFLTARLPAEALVISALFCHARGMTRSGLLLTLAALPFHPLVALPGLLTIVCLSLPLRIGVAGAFGGVLTTIAIALLATREPSLSHPLTVMDASWTEVVRERSQFLFLQDWSIRDWVVNVRPFIFLAFTASTVAEPRIHKLCMVAALVGAAGLAVALIGSVIGPVAILIQGQAWRWVWIPVFVSAALAPLALRHAWRAEKCGALCALLMILGWTLPWAYGITCASLGLLIWLVRARFSLRRASYRWLFIALSVAAGIWTLTKSCAVVWPAISSSGHVPIGFAQTEDIFALKIPAVLLGALVWWAVGTRRTTMAPMALAAGLGVISLLTFPAAFRQARTLAADVDAREFADWESVIPPTGTVLVTPPRDVGAFVWFTLARPNYLTLDQSSGVVFSRATSLEVRRRSEVLLPLMDPDWRIRTALAKSKSKRNSEHAVRPLSRKSLIAVCGDPKLGFVVAPENVGFNPVRHEHTGIWRDWNLYDCEKVRAAVPAK